MSGNAYGVSYERVITDSISVGVGVAYTNIASSLRGLLIEYIEPGFLLTFDAWGVEVVGTASYYFSGYPPEGLFFTGGLDVGYLSITDEQSSASGIVFAPLLTVGYTWIWGWLFVAPEIGLYYAVPIFDLSGFPIEITASSSGFNYKLGLSLALFF